MVRVGVRVRIKFRVRVWVSFRVRIHVRVRVMFTVMVRVMVRVLQTFCLCIYSYIYAASLPISFCVSQMFLTVTSLVSLCFYFVV